MQMLEWRKGEMLAGLMEDRMEVDMEGSVVKHLFTLI